MNNDEILEPCPRCGRAVDITELYTEMNICIQCMEVLAYEKAPAVMWLQLDPTLEYGDQETWHHDEPAAEHGLGQDDVRYMRLSDGEVVVLRDLVMAAYSGMVAAEKHGYRYTDQQAETLKALRKRFVVEVLRTEDEKVQEA